MNFKVNTTMTDQYTLNNLLLNAVIKGDFETVKSIIKNDQANNRLEVLIASSMLNDRRMFFYLKNNMN